MRRASPFAISAQAKRHARFAKAKNGTGPQGGIFIPQGIGYDTISMPGNQGGSNWGTTGANPKTGIVYVVNVNEVAILKLEDVKTRTGRPGSAGVQVYQQHCQACHGANLQGVPGMIKDQMIADMTISLGSIDPCFSCTDRMETIDLKSGATKVWSQDELFKLVRERIA